MVCMDTGPTLPEMFDRYKGLVEQELARCVPSASDDTEPYLPVRYHLGWVERDGSLAKSPLSQGKALRPTLCLFACEALQEDPVRALPAAAALELIHNFSLIHDDIQDMDAERRHQATVWSIWGIPKALVAGNALNSIGDTALLGLRTPPHTAVPAGERRIGSVPNRNETPPETVLKVSQILTDSYLEMIQGQCLDLSFETSTSINGDDYLQMIAFKTGALIRGGVQMGTLLATDGPDTYAAFTKFGECLGRAFQIRDDYLGIWGDEAITGKAAGNDIRRRKKSFPVVFAFEHTTGGSREDLHRIYSQENLDDGDVERVMSILEEVEAAEYCDSLTQESARSAVGALEGVELPGWARDEVAELVDFLARRRF